MRAFFIEALDLGPTVELDRCPKCARVWFDVKELERSVGRHFLPRTRGEPSTHSCPACLTPMGSARIRGDLLIDECGKCGGALLDAHRLELLGGEAPRETTRPEPQTAPPPRAPPPRAPPPRAPPPPEPKPARLQLVIQSFTCERCDKPTPYSEMGHVKGAYVCRPCELEPWPDQVTWDTVREESDGVDGGDTIGDFFDRLFR